MTATTVSRRWFLLCGAAAIFAANTRARADARVIEVTIEKLGFIPAEIEVKVGDTIQWTNHDRIAHTATVKGGWEIMIPPGSTATRLVEAGDDTDYYCRFHPNMTGRIVLSG